MSGGIRVADDMERAIEGLLAGDSLVVAAGAGMGVDSGLPDFRGPEGFWRAYPPFRALKLRFEELANPVWFETDPELAWGFYGHRLHLYRDTRPHAGFHILRGWMERARHGGFVFTSNVDGQFQAAGFDERRVEECHGSIHWMQCLDRCGTPLFAADENGVRVDVDPETFRARPPLPRCPSCGALARPNILMFGDWGWDSSRTRAQQERLREWLEGRPAGSRLVIVECGAGKNVPSVRLFCENLADLPGALLIRINPTDPEVPHGHVGLPLRAREALESLEAGLAGRPAWRDRTPPGET